MKRFIIFVVSFIILLPLFEVLAGIFLTYLYVPDVEESWSASVGLSENVVIGREGGSFTMTIMIALLAASIAYFLSMKLSNVKRN